MRVVQEFGVGGERNMEGGVGRGGGFNGERGVVGGRREWTYSVLKSVRNVASNPSDLH